MYLHDHQTMNVYTKHSG